MSALPRTLITPAPTWRGLSPAALWRRRDLGLLLALRDVRVRYKQTLLGAAWALLQPLLTVAVLYVFFGRVIGLADRIPGAAYPVFLFAALLPWTLFAAGLNGVASSLVNNAHLITKVYFPRLFLPLAVLAAPLLDFAIGVALLLALMPLFGVTPGAGLLLLPLVAASCAAAALGPGLLAAALCVPFRDIRHALPLLVQLGFFVTPILYPPQFVPARYQWLLWLNPMAGPVEAMRAAVLGNPIPVAGWVASTCIALLILTGAVVLFNRLDKRFADLI